MYRPQNFVHLWLSEVALSVVLKLPSRSLGALFLNAMLLNLRCALLGAVHLVRTHRCGILLCAPVCVRSVTHAYILIGCAPR